MGVRYAGNEGESPSDLNWEELENYGTDLEGEQYLGNHEGAGDYEGLQSRADVDAFKVFTEDNFCAKRKENPRIFKQFRDKMQDIKSKYGFQKNESDCGEVRRKKA